MEWSVLSLMCWFLQWGAWACSVRLGRHQHGCLHSAGSTAMEELHLPTKTNREYGRRCGFPLGHRRVTAIEGEKAHAARGKKMMSFFAKELSVTLLLINVSQSKMWPQHIFTQPRSDSCPTQHYVDQIWPPSGSTGTDLSAKSLFCEQLSRLIIKLEALLKVTAKAVQQLGQLFTTTACVHLLRQWLWSLSSLCMSAGRVKAET